MRQRQRLVALGDGTAGRQGAVASVMGGRQAAAVSGIGSKRRPRSGVHSTRAAAQNERRWQRCRGVPPKRAPNPAHQRHTRKQRDACRVPALPQLLHGAVLLLQGGGRREAWYQGRHWRLAAGSGGRWSLQSRPGRLLLRAWPQQTCCAPPVPAWAAGRVRRVLPPNQSAAPQAWSSRGQGSCE